MNEGLISYLEYYLGLEYSPQFAVMIDGKWGSGKTWFIRNLKDKLNMDEITSFSVSLYGKSSTSQIDDDLYKCMHPVLSSKGMILAGAVGRALLKSTIKLSLDDEKKDNLNLSLGLPELDLRKLTNEPCNNLIIFDDFERTSIEIVELLGYINSLTETHGCKVIILADEAQFQLQKKENERALYKSAKEKVVATTITFHPESDVAINNFISEFGDRELKKHLTQNKEILIKLLEKTESNNLRFCRRFLMEFERLYLSTPKEQRNEKILISNLIKVFFILKYESNQRDMKPSHLIHAQNEKGISISTEITKKYKIPVFARPILPLELWDEIITLNKFNRKSIADSLFDAIDKENMTLESWLYLINYLTLNATDFESCLHDVENNLKNNNYKDENIIKHIFGSAIALRNDSIITQKKYNEISKLCHEAIMELKSAKLLHIPDNDFDHPFSRDAWGGYSFSQKQSSEFKSFVDYIDTKSKEQETESFTDIIKIVIEAIKNNDKKLYALLNYSNSEIKTYANKPIFINAIPKEIAAAAIESNNLLNLEGALIERYKHFSLENPLTAEIPFIKGLIKEFQLIHDSSQHPLDKFKIKRFIAGCLEISLEKLERCKST
ncbi:P-loop NTPase fold protein [Pantoea ananatis]|uniref:P-loop NTPase fold protein n=1 Tax=Pantoea ananas TaxID=553 RepID=UPI001B310873|nr:P-loop NTPase fold protein [Pantoea ananatis]